MLLKEGIATSEKFRDFLKDSIRKMIDSSTTDQSRGNEIIGAGTCVIAAYDQEIADSILGIDGVEEFTIDLLYYCNYITKR